MSKNSQTPSVAANNDVVVAYVRLYEALRIAGLDKGPAMQSLDDAYFGHMREIDERNQARRAQEK